MTAPTNHSIPLPNIPRGPTWTPAFRHACLLRWIAARSKGERRAFYASWARFHGDAAAKSLAREVARMWRQLQGGKG